MSSSVLSIVSEIDFERGEMTGWVDQAYVCQTKQEDFVVAVTLMDHPCIVWFELEDKMSFGTSCNYIIGGCQICGNSYELDDETVSYHDCKKWYESEVDRTEGRMSSTLGHLCNVCHYCYAEIMESTTEWIQSNKSDVISGAI